MSSSSESSVLSVANQPFGGARRNASHGGHGEHGGGGGGRRENELIQQVWPMSAGFGRMYRNHRMLGKPAARATNVFILRVLRALRGKSAFRRCPEECQPRRTRRT